MMRVHSVAGGRHSSIVDELHLVMSVDGFDDDNFCMFRVIIRSVEQKLHHAVGFDMSRPAWQVNDGGMDSQSRERLEEAMERLHEVSILQALSNRTHPEKEEFFKGEAASERHEHDLSCFAGDPTLFTESRDVSAHTPVNEPWRSAKRPILLEKKERERVRFDRIETGELRLDEGDPHA